MDGQVFYKLFNGHCKRYRRQRAACTLFKKEVINMLAHGRRGFIFAEE